MYKHCHIQYESMLGGSYGGESECLNVVFQCVWLCDIVGNLPSIMQMDFSEYYENTISIFQVFVDLKISISE